MKYIVETDLPEHARSRIATLRSNNSGDLFTLDFYDGKGNHWFAEATSVEDLKKRVLEMNLKGVKLVMSYIPDSESMLMEFASLLNTQARVCWWNKITRKEAAGKLS